MAEPNQFPLHGSEEEILQWITAASQKADAYSLALGRFVSIFSSLEKSFQTYLWHFAGVAAPTAQAIFSGVRVKAATDLINRIADAQKWENSTKERIRYLFLQLGTLTRLRNDILHYGADIDDYSKDEWTVTNKDFVHIPENVQSTKITPKTLEQATFDLVIINLGMLVLTIGGDERNVLENALKPILESAWRYTPLAPNRASIKNRKHPQKRLRQPKASHP